MDTIPQRHEDELSLNHLLVLDVLLSERSLTKAARVLNLTQPALSKTLARLRQYFGDPLFVRVGLPETLWKLHLARIVTEVRRIKNGGVLHFWLHPHNLGADVSRGIQRLEQVLDVIDRKAPRGTTYASMHDLV